jgi:hypothetical protein
MNKIEKLHTEKEIHRVLTSGTLLEVTLLQVNETYYDFSDQNYWILDCGIELKFPYETFSIGWSSEHDFFQFELKEIKELYTQDNVISLREGEIQTIKGLIGDKVVDSEFVWLEYDVVIDYTMKTQKEAILVEVRLKFESGRSLQISTIDYDLNEEEVPVNYRYYPNEGLLLSLDTLEIGKS